MSTNSARKISLWVQCWIDFRCACGLAVVGDISEEERADKLIFHKDPRKNAPHGFKFLGFAFGINRKKFLHTALVLNRGLKFKFHHKKNNMATIRTIKNKRIASFLQNFKRKEGGSEQDCKLLSIICCADLRAASFSFFSWKLCRRASNVRLSFCKVPGFKTHQKIAKKSSKYFFDFWNFLNLFC